MAGMEDCIADLEGSGPSGLPRYGEELHQLRADLNALLVRLAGVLMTVAKGSGYLRDRTAQRLAPEALFFCVWSAQDPVRQGTVDRLLGKQG